MKRLLTIVVLVLVGFVCNAQSGISLDMKPYFRAVTPILTVTGDSLDMQITMGGKHSNKVYLSSGSTNASTLQTKDTTYLLDPTHIHGPIPYNKLDTIARKSIMANITSSGAVPTGSVAYYGASDATYASTITWTGTTAPSGTTNHVYSWFRFGPYVFYDFTLNYSVPGLALTQVVIDLPSDMPLPHSITGYVAGNYLDMCTGSASTDANSAVATGRAQLKWQTGTTYRIQVITGALASSVVHISGRYTSQ